MKSCLLFFFMIFGGHLFGLDWSSAVNISVVDTPFPKVGVDGQGDGIAIWGSADATVLQVAYYAKSTNSWTAPTTIDSGSVGFPYIAVNSTGDAVAVYSKSDGSNTRLAAAVYTKSTNTWSLSGYLSAAGQNIAGSLGAGTVGIDASGNAVATWSRFNGSNNIAQAAVYTRSTNSWSASSDLSATGQSITNFPSVAVNLSGDAIAIWNRSNGSNIIIQAAIYTASTNSWASAVNLSATGQNAFTPSIGIDDTGDGVATWERSDGSNTFIQSAYYIRSSDSWSSPSNISAAGQNSTTASIAVNGDGNAIAVWKDSTNGGVESSLYTKSSNSWSSVLDVVNSIAGSLQVVIDSSGNGIVVIQISATNAIQASAFTQATTSWASVDTLTSTVGYREFIAMNRIGDAIAIWSQTVPLFGSGPAQAATTSFVTAPTSVSGRQLVNRFVSLREYFNRISWAPSDNVGVASYNIYRDGALIASVGNTTFVYDDHNRSPGVSYTYGISVVTTSGSESAQTTVVVPG